MGMLVAGSTAAATESRLQDFWACHRAHTAVWPLFQSRTCGHLSSCQGLACETMLTLMCALILCC